MKTITTHAIKVGLMAVMITLFAGTSKGQGYHHGDRFIYYPEYEIYYDTHNEVYVYFGGDGWEVSVGLPLPIRNVHIHRARRVLVEHIYYERPHRHYEVHHAKHVHYHDSHYGHKGSHHGHDRHVVQNHHPKGNHYGHHKNTRVVYAGDHHDSSDYRGGRVQHVTYTREREYTGNSGHKGQGHPGNSGHKGNGHPGNKGHGHGNGRGH